MMNFKKGDIVRSKLSNLLYLVLEEPSQKKIIFQAQRLTSTEYRTLNMGKIDGVLCNLNYWEIVEGKR